MLSHVIMRFYHVLSNVPIIRWPPLDLSTFALSYFHNFTYFHIVITFIPILLGDRHWTCPPLWSTFWHQQNFTGVDIKKWKFQQSLLLLCWFMPTLSNTVLIYVYLLCWFCFKIIKSQYMNYHAIFFWKYSATNENCFQL